MDMAEKDKEIIRLLQAGFPLVPEPFKEIGDKIWIDEVAVISRLARLMENGTIRYLGPFLDSKAMGYNGSLAAMDVSPSRVAEVAKILEKFPEVTHNYLREGSPNLWFTIIAKSVERRDAILEEIGQRTKVEKVLLFPSKRVFKVKANLS